MASQSPKKNTQYAPIKAEPLSTFNFDLTTPDRIYDLERTLKSSFLTVKSAYPPEYYVKFIRSHFLKSSDSKLLIEGIGSSV